MAHPLYDLVHTHPAYVLLAGDVTCSHLRETCGQLSCVSVCTQIPTIHISTSHISCNYQAYKDTYMRIHVLRTHMMCIFAFSL